MAHNAYRGTKEDALAYAAQTLEKFTPKHLRQFAVLEFPEYRWAESDVSRLLGRWAKAGYVRNTEPDKRSPEYVWTGLIDAAKPERRHEWNQGVKRFAEPGEHTDWTPEKRAAFKAKWGIDAPMNTDY